MDKNIKGIKIYFGRYYKDQTDMSVYNYCQDLFENDGGIEKFLSVASNHVTAIMAVTNDTGGIDQEKLLNLGGLCPPQCKPKSYENKDPLYHDF